MTGEELDRAIEFLIQNQAKSEARLDRLEQLFAETGKQIERNAETVSQFIEIVTRTFERLEMQQARTDQRIAETNAQIAETRARGAETDARLDRIAALVERNIRGGNGNA
jgi:uncharacterized coiled-coil protein SlyX